MEAKDAPGFYEQAMHQVKMNHGPLFGVNYRFDGFQAVLWEAGRLMGFYTPRGHDNSFEFLSERLYCFVAAFAHSYALGCFFDHHHFSLCERDDRVWYVDSRRSVSGDGRGMSAPCVKDVFRLSLVDEHTVEVYDGDNSLICTWSDFGFGLGKEVDYVRTLCCVTTHAIVKHQNLLPPIVGDEHQLLPSCFGGQS